MSPTAPTPFPPPRPDALPIVDQAGRGAPAWLRAWGWSASAMVLSAVGVVLVALPFYPRGDAWAELGWLIFVAGAVVVVGILAGAVTYGMRLERAGDPHPVITTAVVVPVAVALGAVSAGVGALLAPPVAFWLVSGFSRRRAGQAGVGPHHGLAQRIVVAVVVGGLATTWVVSQLGYRL